MDELIAPEHPVIGIRVNAVELDRAAQIVINAAGTRTPLGVSALAVHGVVLSSRDPQLRRRVNHLDLVVPDGQPVRWALNILHKAHLRERVFGPDLMWEVCDRAATADLPVYLFGSTEDTLRLLSANLTAAFPGLVIAGAQPSRFRSATAQESAADIERIQASGARIVFVGLGCPRQETWVYENRDALAMPALAVGAAFDYHAGLLRRAPRWMQRAGLEWLARLIQDPQRLWKRYASTNPRFVVGVLAQWLGRSFDEAGAEPETIRPG